ncbi:hypothetical protein MKK50_15785 [Methylobacterium sp. J-043]|jgi:hypothetical protein|uniref:Uncharacterized protein n=1 Tax=Methylobacterium goesingense TaxID=243690 RepID=A0ABV2LB63_9HYPH|nr:MULTISPECIES: hypothetical protein [Methylobacteriaceae]MCJ2030833.1 hypothetical protein [Methylobacterium sp. J-043]KQP04890.1 hypothetical protein ASF28_18865 [Methylobacterium sp. Leaf99]KQT49072.1 hypothetical protein ASG52_08825 [Methylobacterium sp. Leaf456]UYW33835.1 hypothetical protein OKB92_07070 [Methylorubrum extorquens]GJD74520.1 hypothetical protein CFIICLFH_2754 [Methylobacterium goesingense]
MFSSKLETAAVAWREARMKACAAPVEGFVKDKKGDSIAVPNLQVWTDLGAAETTLSEAVVAHLAKEAEFARLEARPKLFVIHGWMHHAPHEEEACTLEEAVQSAKAANDWGYWFPEKICTVAGELVLAEAELYERIWAEDAA